MQNYSPDSHWRDTAREPKLFIVNANASVPLLLFLLHIRWWTFFASTGTVAFLMIINYYGFNIPNFFRFLRAQLAGRRRISRPDWMR